LQRSRLLAAAVSVIDEQGYPLTSVAHITARARVSRRTFYELFADREECLAAVLGEMVALVERELATASLTELAWRERVRGGLWVLLSFFDREPALARVCVVQMLRGGSAVLERRQELLARLAAFVDEGREISPRAAGCTALTGEGVVGAAFAIVYGRLLGRDPRPLRGLLGELTGMIVLPYLGVAAARREQARPAPAPSSDAPRGSTGPLGIGGAGKDPLGGVRMRLTYRTTRVLEGVGEHPGASNRQVSEYAGIHDQGQISKLLARLERLGLLANSGGGALVKGEPNAWALTRKGEQVAQGIRMRTAIDRQAA
jgi:AcrR family transcriptional regulator